MKRILLLMITCCAIGFAQAQVGVVRSSGAYSVKKVQDYGPLSRQGNIYFYHGEPMKEAQMVEFIKKDCAEAYHYYLRSRKMEVAGWVLFGVGAGICTIGGSALLGASSRVEDENKYEGMIAGALALYGSGAIIGLVGLPLGIVGTVHKKNVHKVYNTWCGYKELETGQNNATPLELRLTSGANGLGLALTF